MATENCTVCGNKIEVMAYRGTDWCSEDCKKSVADVSSVGTYMFVTYEEEKVIKQSRQPGSELVSSIDLSKGGVMNNGKRR